MNEVVPTELERRITMLESGAEVGSDFDATSWFWMIFLGVLIPIGLIVWGWIG